MVFGFHLLKLFSLLLHLLLEVPCLNFEIFAHPATHGERFHRAIRRMFHSKRTVLLALALVPWRPTTVVAVHAVVVDTTAMVGSDVAAKVALVLNEVLLVLLAVTYAVLIVLILAEEPALRTHLSFKGVAIHVQTITESLSCEDSATYTSPKNTTFRSLLLLLLSLELLHVCIVSALPESSKVGVLALVAFVIVKVVHGKLLKVVKILALRVCKPLIKVKSFVFGSKHTLLSDLLVKVSCLINRLLEPLECLRFRKVDPLVA